jgi:HPt (histidine-containing phosphotransfer) domain-containing protein
VENDVQQGVADSGPCVDASALSKLREIGDAEFVVEMIDALLSFAPRVMSEARAGLGSGNYEPVARMGHSLKSSARILGADTMRNIASQIERHAREGHADLLPGLLDQMDSAYTQTKAYLIRVKDNGGKPL